MTYYVPCDLSIDTVTLNWYGIYDLDTTNWKYTPAEKPGEMDSFTRFRQDGITVRYYPCCSLVSASFSASRVANKYNCYEYTNDQYDYVKETVERVIQQATELPIQFEEGIISRLDVYRSLILPSDEDCRRFITWLQKQPTIGKYKREARADNGERRWFKTGLTLNAYIKNDDPHLPNEVRVILPPTVRIEVQGRKELRKKLLGRQVPATVLRYPAAWVQYYNDALDKFKLNGSLHDVQGSTSIAAEVIRLKHHNPRPSTIVQELRLLERFLAGDTKRRSKAVGLLNKIYSYNVCPFPISTPKIIQNQTLTASAVISVDKQRDLEHNEEILERTLAIFRAYLNRKEVTPCEETIHYTIYVMPTSSGRTTTVEIEDSS